MFPCLFSLSLTISLYMWLNMQDVLNPNIAFDSLQPISKSWIRCWHELAFFFSFSLVSALLFSPLSLSLSLSSPLSRVLVCLFDSLLFLSHSKSSDICTKRNIKYKRWLKSTPSDSFHLIRWCKAWSFHAHSLVLSLSLEWRILFHNFYLSFSLFFIFSQQRFFIFLLLCTSLELKRVQIQFNRRTVAWLVTDGLPFNKKRKKKRK